MRGGWSIGTKRNECSPHLCSLEIEHFGDCCDFVGFLTDEDLGENDSRLAAPRAHGVRMGGFTAAGITDGREDLEAFGEAAGIVGLIWISWNSGILKPQDDAQKPVRKPWIEFSPIQQPCHPGFAF